MPTPEPINQKVTIALTPSERRDAEDEAERTGQTRSEVLRRRITRVNPKRRFNVLERDGFRCVYCGASMDNTRLEVDHVVAISRGGTSEYTNLVTSCEACNDGKGARTIDPEVYARILQHAADIAPDPQTPRKSSGKKRGPAPEGEVARSKRSLVSMMPSTFDRFKETADAEGVSVSTWLRDAGLLRLATAEVSG